LLYETDGMSAPWIAPGWKAQADEWIFTEISRLQEPVHTIQMVRNWCISFVQRVETTSRIVFFKATIDLPLFVNEGRVMTCLAQMYPEHIPAPLAINTPKNWMLLEDLGQPIGREASLEMKTDLFKAMAHIHIDSMSRIDHLTDMGCIDRRIPWLRSHLESLMADEVTLTMLTQAEREDLRSALPRLDSLLAELDALPIPPSLLHGDLNTGNVAFRDGKIKIFDWTDAAISHPFFDLDLIFSAEDPAVRETLETVYLSAWERIFPADQVRRAFELARVVYGLYHAASYQFILNNLDETDRSEINSADYFFRQVLKDLKSGVSSQT
jgi:hypothetical protein